jgi:glycosyltransferase involved in cell wall biosynthesis
VTRVFVIDHTTARSGGEVALLRLIRGLVERGLHFIVALPDDEGMLYDELRKLGNVEIHVVPIGRRLLRTGRSAAPRALITKPLLLIDFFRLVWAHSRLIRRSGAGVVLTNSTKSDYYGSLAAFLARKPVVWFLHDIVDHHYFPWWARTTLVAFARIFASMIFCNSDATADTFAKLGYPRRKFVTVYPPLAVGDVASERETGLRSELGLPATTRLIVMVGRITPPKGQMEFVRAFSRIAADAPDAVALIAGDAIFGVLDERYKADVEAEIGRAGLGERIRLLGHRSDVPSILSQADVVVFPSVWPEGYGLVAAEAMQLGKSVIATAAGGTAELIEDGVTGLRIRPGHEEDLAEAIRRLLGDPELAARLGSAGRERVGRLTSAENIDRMADSLRAFAA